MGWRFTVDYLVADIALVAYLSLRGVRHNTVTVDGRRCIFHYPNDPQIRRLQRDFELDAVTVPPRQFYRALRSVRLLTADIHANAATA